MKITEKATEFLQKYSEWIHDANLLGYVFKWISSSWIKGLYTMASGVEDILDQVFKVFGFLENDTIGKIYTSMRILSGTILVIMIIVLAYKFILNERVNLQAGLFRAALIVCLGIQLPGMITSSVDLAEKVYGQTKTLDGGETSTLSYSIVKGNLADLQYASKKGFGRLNGQAGTPKNNLSEKGFQSTDLTEIITPDSLKDMKEKAYNKDDVSYLEYKLKTDEEGNITSEKIKNGTFSFFDDGKYRFTYKTGTITLSLVTVSFAFICSAFIIASSLLELIFAKLMFPVLSVSDIETGQRAKNIFLDIGSSLLSIMLTGFSLSIFKLYFSYIGTLHLGFLAYLILCIVGVRITIDGPNFFGKFLGLDIGVRSGWQAMVGTVVAAKAAKSGTAAAASAGVSTAKAGIKAGKSIKEHAGNAINRMRVNNGVHESNNDKSIQSRSTVPENNGSARSSVQEFAANMRQSFAMQDQQEPVTQTQGSNRSAVPNDQINPSVQDKDQVSSNGELPSGTNLSPETTYQPMNASASSSSVSQGKEPDGKSIGNVSAEALKQMGESGNRSESPIDPINGNRTNGLATGKTGASQKIQRTTIPPLQTPSRKAAIQAATDKVNQNNNMQQSSNSSVSEGNAATTQRANDQEVKRSVPETSYGTSAAAPSQSVQSSEQAPEGASVALERVTSVSPSTAAVVQRSNPSSTSAGTQIVQQSPSIGIERSTVTPARRSEPKSGSIKQPGQPTNHRSVTSQKPAEKSTAPTYHIPTVESKTKELSTPKELATKYLKESSVTPENDYYDIYQSMNKVNADDYI
ncbi:pLS20_p028 family conjugation system transmembrane protein [Enterococcus casseliflavus]|uniref:pLS20_p028 family conjugation system transmembrane protein n=1 Tax=Enterococcus casseliflavus TaxID=37734 RepID=UPI0035DFC7EA